MANEIRISYDSGVTLYAHVRKASDLTYWNGSSFESYNAAHWSTYTVALTETGSTGEYAASFPTAITTSGTYDTIIYKRAGGSAATSDAKVNGGQLLWDGSQELDLSDVEVTVLGGNITITSANPVAQSQGITIFRGDDYYAADNGRALTWTTASAASWPDLTGATISFVAHINANNTSSGDASLVVAGTVVTATGAAKSVKVELTHTNTATLGIGAAAYVYYLDATLATSGHKVTLATGTMTVKDTYTS